MILLNISKRFPNNAIVISWWLALFRWLILLFDYILIGIGLKMSFGLFKVGKMDLCPVFGRMNFLAFLRYYSFISWSLWQFCGCCGHLLHFILSFERTAWPRLFEFPFPSVQSKTNKKKGPYWKYMVFFNQTNYTLIQLELVIKSQNFYASLISWDMPWVAALNWKGTHTQCSPGALSRLIWKWLYA